MNWVSRFPPFSLTSGQIVFGVHGAGRRQLQAEGLTEGGEAEVDPGAVRADQEGMEDLLGDIPLGVLRGFP